MVSEVKRELAIVAPKLVDDPAAIDSLLPIVDKLGVATLRRMLESVVARGPRPYELDPALWTDNDNRGKQRRRRANGADTSEQEDNPAQIQDDGGVGEWDAGTDDKDPPPRGWLLGNIFCREFVSALIGEGGAGKSALRLVQLISLALGRPLLKSDHVFQRCRVLIVSLEDNDKELRRRIKAVLLFYNIKREDLEGWLFIYAPGKDRRPIGKLMDIGEHGRPESGELVERLSRTIERRQIDILSLDPFKKTHSVPENDNTSIDLIVDILAHLADKYNIAADTTHHVSKGLSDPGNADRGRGASSMKDAGRLFYTLTVMSVEEALMFGIPAGDRRLYVRMDSAKVNIIPGSGDARWFRLVGVQIGNSSLPLYPNGDTVQAVESWTPPDLWTDLSVPTIHKILDEIEVGLPDGNRFTDASAAKHRAAWQIVVKHCPSKTEGQARQIIKEWVGSGLLAGKEYTNPVDRHEAKGLFVDNAKRPS